MGQLTITLPSDLEREIRETVGSQGYGSISDFARDAIKEKLTQRPKYWERVILTLALENNKLLRTIADDSSLEGSELLSALQNGYATNYFDIENIARRDELPKEGAEFVMDTLGMYGELQRSVDVHKLSKEIADQTLFEGFDGNAGDGYLGYANFLVDNGRFSYVKPLDKTPHLNSHSQVNDLYRRMLEEYKNIKGSKPLCAYEVLTRLEVERILGAQIHPENR